MFKKNHLVAPTDLMPMFIENKVFAVFLAEPVSDFISVAVASTLFLCNIKKILAKA